MMEERRNLINRMDTEACAYAIQGLADVLQDLELQDLAAARAFTGLSQALTVFAERAIDAHEEARAKDSAEHQTQLARFIPATVLNVAGEMERKGHPVLTDRLASALGLAPQALQSILEGMVKDGLLRSTSWGLMLPETAAKLKATRGRDAKGARHGRKA